MPPLVAFLYYLCLTLLAALGLFVWLRNRRSPMHRCFALGAAALFAWILTLFIYDRQVDPVLLGALGRINFVFSDFAVLSAYLFVEELTGAKVRLRRALLVETAVLSLLTLATPFIDRAEVFQAGQRTTLFGPLFGLHVVHTVGYLAAAVLLALYGAHSASRRLRGQLLVIGIGIGVTAGVAVVADLMLPLGFHDFAFQDFGPLATVLLLASIGYAITVQHLFDIRIIIKKGVVLALLLATVHALYSGVILLVTDALPPSAEQYRFELEVLNIMILAFGFEPLKKFLEKEVDRLLYHRDHGRSAVIARLANELAGAPTLDRALRIVLHTLDVEFHPKFSAVFVLESGDGGTLKVKRLEHTGKVAPARLLSLIQEPVLSFFQNCSQPVSTDALIRKTRNRDTGLWSEPVKEVHESQRQTHHRDQEFTTVQRVLEELSSRQIAVAIPIHIAGELAGILAVGRRRPGERFGKTELGVLDKLGAQTAAAISRARF